MIKLKSSDDFSPLKSVVVGVADFSGLPKNITDLSARFNFYPDIALEELIKFPTGSLSCDIINEANEDADNLVSVLESFAIKVYRPERRNFQNIIKSSEGWETEQFNGWSPRDHYLAANETLIIAPTPTRARQQEYLNMYDIALECEKNGSLLISAPIPPLKENLYGVTDGKFSLNETEIAFEAANILRVGQHYFYQISVSGNWRGFYWLEKILKIEGITLIPLVNIYNGTHIDSTIYIPKPGVIVINSERINPTNLPEPLNKYFNNWVKIVPEINEDINIPQSSLSSKWLGINAFSINHEYAIVDYAQDDLCRKLEKVGITPIRHKFRHSNLLGGGLHCNTFDLERDGELNNYFE